MLLYIMNSLFDFLVTNSFYDMIVFIESFIKSIFIGYHIIIKR